MSLEELLPPNQQKYSNIMMLRSALVVSTLLIALSVPFFGKLIDIFGKAQSVHHPQSNLYV
jgi:vesicular inhibitory amino acid transporter